MDDTGVVEARRGRYRGYDGLSFTRRLFGDEQRYVALGTRGPIYDERGSVLVFL